MFKVEWLNFRNILLCLAIGLQLLTYMKHEGASIVGLPATLPIGSPFAADESADSDRTDTHRSASANPTPSVTSSTLASAERPQPRGKELNAARSPHSIGEPTVQPASPKQSGGRKVVSTPATGSPELVKPAPEPISFVTPAPPAAAGPEPTVTDTDKPAPPPPPPPPPPGTNVDNPPEPAVPGEPELIIE